MASTSPTGVAPVVQVHPTRRCNLACAHCYTASGPHVRDELPFALLANCIEHAARLGYRQLAVSGGEPLLYHDLANLLAQARDAGMLTSITTNGMLVSAERWERVAPLIDVVAISLDGTREEHDTIRRHSGAFDRTVANLAHVRASGVPFGFIFTLTLYNVSSLEFVVRLAADVGARSVQVHPLTLHGRASTSLPDARPDGIELATAIVEAQRLGARLGVVVHVDAVDLSQLLARREQLVPTTPVSRMIDVAPVLIVRDDAQVVPMTHEVCASMWLGSLRDASLSELVAAWLAGDKAERLVDACAQTWSDLVRAAPNAV